MGLQQAALAGGEPPGGGRGCGLPAPPHAQLWECGPKPLQPAPQPPSPRPRPPPPQNIIYEMHVGSFTPEVRACPGSACPAQGELALRTKLPALLPQADGRAGAAPPPPAPACAGHPARRHRAPAAPGGLRLHHARADAVPGPLGPLGLQPSLPARPAPPAGHARGGARQAAGARLWAGAARPGTRPGGGGACLPQASRACHAGAA